MEIKVTDFDYKGRGFGRYNNKSVFLDGGIIGDTVEFEIVNSKHNFDIGHILKIKEQSKYRVESKCPYSSSCGGCDFLEYQYSEQKKWKTAKVENDMKKIGEINQKVEPILGSDNQYFYRNNIQLKVVDGKLGYYKKNSRDIVAIDRCIIAEEEINKAIEILKKWNGLNTVEEIVIRQNNKGELMIVLITKNEVKKINNLLNSLLELKLNSLFVNYRKNAKYRFGRDFKKIYGEDYLEDEILGIKLKLSPESFLQINRKQTEKLYSTAIEFMDIKPDDVIMDLYSGIGSISLLMNKAKKVVGVEVIEAAVDNARNNAELNMSKNTTFICGKVEDVIDKLVDEGTNFNKVMLDPPRAGVDEKVLTKINELNPERIVYISCNSSTQARDLKILKDYEIEKIQPVDMFINNVHVESIALLERVKS